jgi:hypothetical protein
VSGDGYSAVVPAGWRVDRPPRTVTASNPDGPEAVSIAVFTLARRFDPTRWTEAVAELNDVAARVAERIASTARVSSSRDGVVGGRRARLYEIEYRRAGEPMLDLVVFLLVGRREYQLTCRIRVDEPAVGTDACALLRDSFRVRSS